jgi:hypothetical protein
MEQALVRRTPYRLSAAGGALLGMGALDLLSTVGALRAGLAVEANPVLAPFAALGLSAFVAAKIALTAGPVLGLEALRRRTRWATWALRVGAVAYPVFYLFAVLRLNG